MMEELLWSGDRNSKTPSISSLIGEPYDTVRSSIPEKDLCKLFCSGADCKYCNPAAHFHSTQMAIDGLFSTWITKNILAMSRPSSVTIHQFDIINQFKNEDIKTVINMQSHGEHSSCGYGVGISGYSYDPENFMKENIYFHNFCWRDYGFGSADSILNIMAVMKLALLEGKLAVHCHAGLGRTGVVIACFLIYNNRMPHSDAVTYVRHRRPGSIQTDAQVLCVKKFAQYIENRRRVFPKTKEQQFTLDTFLNFQDRSFFGPKRKLLKFSPLVLHACFRKLLWMSLRSVASGDDMCNDCDNLSSKIIDVRKSTTYYPAPSGSSTYSSTNDTPGGDVTEYTYHFCSVNSFTSLQRINAEMGVGPQRMGVVRSILTTHYTDSVVLAADAWKDELNATDVWDKFPDGVVEPEILSKLALDWLQYLKSPVLRVQDLKSMITEDLKEVPQWLTLFERPVAGVLQLVARFLVCLRPLPDVVEEALIERFIGALMHDPRSNRCEGDLCKNGVVNRDDTDELLVPQPTPIWLNGLFDEQVILAKRLLQELVHYTDTEEGRQHLMDDFWLRL